MARKDHKLRYEIRVQGYLDESWSDWFEGMTITVYIEPDCPPITSLTGEVVDQAALQGILLRIHDLNMALVSVTQIGLETTSDQSHSEKGDIKNGD
jgi:hypothetical protein